jgi:hypothetical protein
MISKLKHVPGNDLEQFPWNIYKHAFLSLYTVKLTSRIFEAHTVTSRQDVEMKFHEL